MTPGWLRSEMMLDNYLVTVGLACGDGTTGRGYPIAPGAFTESESPRFVGRGVAAIAATPTGRWNQRSASSASSPVSTGSPTSTDVARRVERA